MKKTKILSLILFAAMLAGCPVVSKNIVGLEDYTLDAQKIDGTWINEDGAMMIKTLDAEKGMIKIIFLEDKEDIEKATIKIMKGKKWLYFNMLPEESDKEPEYLWGRISIEDNRIIFWHTANDPFAEAVKKRKIKGKIDNKKQISGEMSFETSTVILTDSAKNIINLVESSEKNYFAWDDPTVIIKLTK
ncbi:MAG TPA: hypothetical protein ENN23_05225 [Deltaproteobacteria bacterium]|nr:hypothetical protein [Deltaproteobacteria bacterium]